MRQRPLPKTVTPLADELLSGWLTRLAVTNHCEVDELLEHIGVDRRQAAMLDFDVEVDANTAEKISIAARVAAETVQSLTRPCENLAKSDGVQGFRLDRRFPFRGSGSNA